MKRPVVTLAVSAVLAAIGYMPVTIASAATKAERARAAAEMVAEALHHEIYGLDSRRSEFLASALEQLPGYAPALWHSGHVRLHDKWLKFDELPKLVAEDDRLAAYRRVRDQYPKTLQGRLALAEWCAKNKLAEQQRAHLTEVLEIDPNHQQARRLLGYRRVDGVWLSEAEVAAGRARAQQAVQALRQWKPELIEIRRGLEHRKRAQRDRAAERLQQINDPAAVPAIELALCGHNEQVALLGIETLGNTDAHEASAALARQAVFSPWQKVREAAAEKLKARDKETYVPVLLSALQSPIQSRAALYQDPRGRLVYRHAFFREGQEHDELAVFDTIYERFIGNDPVVRDLGGRFTPREAVELDRLDAVQAVQRDAVMRAQARQVAVAQQNAVNQRLNQRVCWVLSTTTGELLPPNPESWFEWWTEYNEVYVPGYKPVRTAYRQESRPVIAGQNRTFQNASHSCLAAGTPVWTASGPVPIEQIQVGDRVLSQDTQTGELAYKPVLRTTVREPVKLLKIEFGGESIKCSGGHPFWVCGDGWVKARDLVPGKPFHSVTGTAEIGSLGSAPAERIYNLIVADFHSYFVGKARILSHDITIRKPTNVVVPGLAGP